MPNHVINFHNASKVDIKQTTDIVSKIMSFSTFKDIFNSSKVCIIWKYACNDKLLIIRLLKERWKYNPFDYGSGSGIQFNITNILSSSSSSSSYININNNSKNNNKNTIVSTNNLSSISSVIEDETSSCDIQSSSNFSSVSLNSSINRDRSDVAIVGIYGANDVSGVSTYNNYNFNLNKISIQQNWKMFLIAKEYLQIKCDLTFEPMICGNISDIEFISINISQMLVRLFNEINKCNIKNNYNNNSIKLNSLNIESYRWILEIFDFYMLFQTPIKTKNLFFQDSIYLPPKSIFPQIDVSTQYIDKLFYILSNNLHCKEITQIATRTIGVLAINEKNRKHIGSLDKFSLLMQVIDQYSYQNYHHDHDQQDQRNEQNYENNNSLDLDRFCSNNNNNNNNNYNDLYDSSSISIIGNVLWTCVILCRPLGAQEGEAYSRTDSKNYRNIKYMEKANSIKKILFIINKFKNYPSVLAKAFWLIVNLSLIDQIKRYLIHKTIIKKICKYMTKYPNHRELQYRACFALINVTLRSHARHQLVSQNGIQLIFNAMKRFPDDHLLQKCCINVIRSLLSGGDPRIVGQLTQHGVSDVLQDLVSKYLEKHKDVATLATKTLQYLI